METITLWFEYTNPIGWFTKLSEKPFALGYATFCGLFLAYALSVPEGSLWLGGALEVLVVLWAKTTKFQLLGFASLLSTVGSASSPVMVYTFVGISIVIGALVLIAYGPWVTKYLAGPGQVGIYFRRLALIYIVTVGVMYLSMLGAEHYGNQYWYLPLGLPVSILQIIPVVINTVGLLMITLMLFFAAMEIVLQLVRAVAWRIVEYSNGAWSAIILICTVAIGLYKAFLE
jgi:hypothetical protein